MCISAVSTSSYHPFQSQPTNQLTLCLRKTAIVIGITTLVAGGITTAVGFAEEDNKTRNTGLIVSAVGLTETVVASVLTCMAMKAKARVTHFFNGEV